MCNNPFINIKKTIPKNYVEKWPEGLFAYRTSPSFLRIYKGQINGFNIPRNNKQLGLYNVNNHNIKLEDHRNIILSSFNLLYYLGITNIIIINLENYMKVYFN